MGEKPLADGAFSGLIRCEDVRQYEIDKVEIYKSFRPGDIVRAVVTSLGDRRSYILSTARNELGVVIATSAAGAIMTPLSWQEMVCPVTKVRELRKVAKTAVPSLGGDADVADVEMAPAAALAGAAGAAGATGAAGTAQFSAREEPRSETR